MNKLNRVRVKLAEAHQVMIEKHNRYNLDKKWLSDWNKVRAFYKRFGGTMYRAACKQVGVYLSACKRSKSALKTACNRVKRLLDSIKELRQPRLVYAICESNKAICYYLIKHGSVVSAGLWYSSISHLLRLLTFNYKLYQTYPKLELVSFEECMAQGIE